jgi:hypothetical protein
LPKYLFISTLLTTSKGGSVLEGIVAHEYKNNSHAKTEIFKILNFVIS